MEPCFQAKKIRPSKTIPPARISAPLPKQLSLSSTRGSLQPRLSRLFHHSVSDFFEHDHHPASSSSSFHHHGAQHSSIILSLTPPKTRNCPFGRVFARLYANTRQEERNVPPASHPGPNRVNLDKARFTTKFRKLSEDCVDVNNEK